VKKIASLISAIVLLLPMIGSAAVNSTYFTDVIKEGSKVLNDLVIFLVALAVVWFIWNVIRYTLADDEEKKGAAKMQMVWGIIAIAVIVSVWGLVAILRNMFGVDNNSAIPTREINSMIPQVR